jgi:hypothetical protein
MGFWLELGTLNWAKYLVINMTTYFWLHTIMTIRGSLWLSSRTATQTLSSWLMVRFSVVGTTCAHMRIFSHNKLLVGIPITFTRAKLSLEEP